MGKDLGGATSRLDRRGAGVRGLPVSVVAGPTDLPPTFRGFLPLPGTTRRCAAVTGALITFAWASLSLAQQTSPSQPAPEPTKPPETQAPAAAAPEPIQYWLDFPALYAFPADVDGGGTASVARAGAWLGIDIPFQQYNRFSLEMSSEWSFYNFENAVGLDPAGGDPAGAAEEFQLGARLFIRTATRWGVFGAAEIISAGEPGVNFADSLRYTAYGGARYWFSEKMSMSGGLSLRTRFEENAFIAPFVTIDWQIDDQWSLKTSARVLERGTNFALAYAPSDTLTLSLSAGYEPREYRLDNSGFNPGGSMLDERIPVALGLLWKAAPGVEVHAGAGVDVWQKYVFRDSSGNQVSEGDTSFQPFASVGLEFKF